MSLWAFIPGKHLEAIGSLPQSARRLDTGAVIHDLPGVNIMWAHACGWWNLDTIQSEAAELARINHLTPDELDTLRDEVVDVLTARQQRHDYVDDARTAWAAAKDQGQDRLDLVPPYERPTPPTGRPQTPVTQANALAWIDYLARYDAFLVDNDLYLDNWIRFLQRSLIGGGTVQSPGIGDVLMVLAQVVAGLLDQSTGVELPDEPIIPPEEP